MRSRHLLFVLALCAALLLPGVSQADRILWFSPLNMSTSDSRLTIEPGQPNTGIHITTTTAGDLQWVNLGLTLPSDVRMEELTICYELASSGSFISQTRLSRMTTPNAATVIHDDGTDQTDIGPICYQSVVNSLPVEGTITLALRLNFGSNEDWVDIGGIGLRVSDVVSGLDGPQPASPIGLSLQPNRPNPFHPSTTISYTLESAGLADLQIFDVGGRSVRTLFHGSQSAGEHAVQWDGRDDQGAEMSAGTYYYALRAGDQVASRGMVLLR